MDNSPVDEPGDSEVPKRRVGIILPPHNPVVVPEYERLLASLTLQFAALPKVEGDLKRRLDQYRQRMGEPAEDLVGEGMDAVVVACTGCSYGLSIEDDSFLASEVARIAQAPAVTATGAIYQLLGELGVRSLTLVSPYPKWLTERAEQFWTRAGVRVDSVAQIPGSGLIYDLEATAVAEILGRVLADTAKDVEEHAVLVTGTGATTLAEIEQVGASSPVPVISSNLAGAWWALRQLNLKIAHDETVSPALVRLQGGRAR